MKNIYHIVAAKENDFCGVLDYTKCLVKALVDESGAGKLLMVDGWRWKDIFKLRSLIVNKKDSVINIQYPSLAMGYFPLMNFIKLFCFRCDLYITVHEFSVFSFIRKMYLLPISFFSKGIIFTNDFEKKYFLRFFPWAGHKVHVIPIGTNIRASKSIDNDRQGVCYFGQITENKGIDEFLDTVAIIRSHTSDIKCTIIGALLDGDLPIVKRMYALCESLDIKLLINKTNDEVSSELAKHQYALLPFPDGVTDKRGSALACLANGLELVTTFSGKTPQWWKNISDEFVGPENAAVIILESKKNKEGRKKEINKQMELRQWDNIAQAYSEVYLK
eukprot:gnl/Carplike_NY0171/2173_a2924_358.p1 GENE.gnl/Carplike_NY0171/2173_a2924_358~~gnl/Carplike_NY0171/2173_a2924_358.p1  ORF type:complete len:332 (-),score=-0.95 gnl/Carplike_NY0171/2173_a2924_358:515-1510(-)